MVFLRGHVASAIVALPTTGLPWCMVMTSPEFRSRQGVGARGRAGPTSRGGYQLGLVLDLNDRDANCRFGSRSALVWGFADLRRALFLGGWCCRGLITYGEVVGPVGADGVGPAACGPNGNAEEVGEDGCRDVGGDGDDRGVAAGSGCDAVAAQLLRSPRALMG